MSAPSPPWLLRRAAGRPAAALADPAVALGSWCCMGCAPGSWRRPAAAQGRQQVAGSERAVAAAVAAGGGEERCWQPHSPFACCIHVIGTGCGMLEPS